MIGIIGDSNTGPQTFHIYIFQGSTPYEGGKGFQIVPGWVSDLQSGQSRTVFEISSFLLNVRCLRRYWVEFSFKLFAQEISGTDPCLLTFSARKIDFAQCFVGSTFVAYQPLGEDAWWSMTSILTRRTTRSVISDMVLFLPWPEFGTDFHVDNNSIEIHFKCTSVEATMRNIFFFVCHAPSWVQVEHVFVFGRLREVTLVWFKIQSTKFFQSDHAM